MAHSTYSKKEMKYLPNILGYIIVTYHVSSVYVSHFRTLGNFPMKGISSRSVTASTWPRINS